MEQTRIVSKNIFRLPATYLFYSPPIGFIFIDSHLSPAINSLVDDIFIQDKLKDHFSCPKQNAPTDLARVGVVKERSDMKY